MVVVLALGVFGVLGRSPTERGATTTTTTATTVPTPQGTSCPEPNGSSDRRTFFEQAPPTCIDARATYQARFVTSAGDFVATLDADRSPLAVNNFVFLARYHFYDGLAFYKVIGDFYAQTGDPINETVSGPGYFFPDDPLPQPGEYQVGSLVMAHQQADQNGSQLLVLLGTENPQTGEELPPVFPLFGQVTDGMDVIERIGAAGGPLPQGQPATTYVIRSVTIVEERA